MWLALQRELGLKAEAVRSSKISALFYQSILSAFMAMRMSHMQLLRSILPQFTPMMKRPRNRNSYNWNSFVHPISTAPTIPNKLFSSSPPFLQKKTVTTRFKYNNSDEHSNDLNICEDSHHLSRFIQRTGDFSYKYKPSVNRTSQWTTASQYNQHNIHFMSMWPRIVTNFFIIKPTWCTNFTNLFCHETLHVSDSSSVRHQEFIHCTLSNGICHTGL